MSELQVRTAGVDDIEDLRRIDAAGNQRYDEVGMTAMTEAHPSDEETLRRLIAARQVWVTDDADGRPIGFVTTAEIDTALHLDHVSVDPEHAHRGIGRRLVQYLIDQARRASRHTVTLTAFRDVPWHAPYFERLGFTVIPEEELTEGLRQLREREAEAGLDAWPRVSMCMDISDH